MLKKINFPVQFSYKYISVFYFTFIPGSVMFSWTNTCLQEPPGSAGEVQISCRPVLLFNRARSCGAPAGSGARYQNSRHASPSSPRGALSNVFTATSVSEKTEAFIHFRHSGRALLHELSLKVISKE